MAAVAVATQAGPDAATAGISAKDVSDAMKKAYGPTGIPKPEKPAGPKYKAP